MKLEEYKSGEYVKMNDYKAFIPSKINYNWGWDDTKLDKLLAEANRQIGELNAYSLDKSFKQAMARLSIEGIEKQDADIPELYVRSGIDANEIYLVKEKK